MTVKSRLNSNRNPDENSQKRKNPGENSIKKSHLMDHGRFGAEPIRLRG